jgi:NADH-quinone oxidoreductase subunit G
MSQTPSIDISNGKGCNIDLWTRDNEILRITPRENNAVNNQWMPDEGRFVYSKFNDNRASRPAIKLDAKNQTKTSWNNAVETFAETLEAYSADDILLIGSPHASVEENYAFNKFFNLLGAPNAQFTPHIIDGYGDDFLLVDDQAPNTNGCRLLNLDESNSDQLKSAVAKAKVVLILADDLLEREALSEADLNDPYVISFATNMNATARVSDLVIPITCIAEHAASYVNVDGRIQRSFPAKETQYTNRRLNLEMSEGRLDRYGTNFDNWVNAENKVDCLPLWDFLNIFADRLGLDYHFEHSRAIMAEISSLIPAFEHVNYEIMDKNQGIQLRIGGQKVEQG